MYHGPTPAPPHHRAGKAIVSLGDEELFRSQRLPHLAAITIKVIGLDYPERTNTDD